MRFMFNIFLNSLSVIVQAVGLTAMTQTVILSQIMPQEPIAIYRDYLASEPVLAYSAIEEQKKEIQEVPEVLKRIAYCESGNKQFDENGQVIRGRENPKDTGKYQLNTFYHLEAAQRLGYNIFTEQGNEGYAIWLYNKEGTKPWIYSKFCWNK